MGYFPARPPGRVLLVPRLEIPERGVLMTCHSTSSEPYLSCLCMIAVHIQLLALVPVENMGHVALPASSQMLGQVADYRRACSHACGFGVQNRKIALQ